MDQLVDKGVIGDSFSMCYGGMDIGGGAMVLGAMPTPPDMIFSPSDPVRRYHGFLFIFLCGCVWGSAIVILMHPLFIN
jgi:hypothetical protein